MFGFPNIGTTELILILVIVVIIFGVGKLPQIGGALGKTIRDFRKAQKDVSDTLGEAQEEIEGIKKDIEAATKPEE